MPLAFEMTSEFDVPSTFTMHRVHHDMRTILGRGERLCFRTNGTYFCRCEMESKPLPLLHYTLYPGMGIVAGEGLLLDVKHVPWGSHFWSEALRAPYGVTGVKMERAQTIPLGWGHYLQIAFTGVGFRGEPVPATWACRAFGSRDGKSLLARLWTIQRAAREFIRRRREARLLSVLMGLHERLGSQSPLSLLPADLLRNEILLLP